MATADSPHRVDPYRNFRFRVRIDGRIVAGVAEVSRLHRSSELTSTDRGSGGGHHTAQAVTLSQGVTHDDGFRHWIESNPASPAHRRRHEVVLDEHDEAGRLVGSFTLRRAWVSEYQGLPDLDANADAVAIESLTLENEGWRRDDPAADDPTALG